MSVIIALVPIALMDFLKVSLSSTVMIISVAIMTIFTALQRVHWEVYNSYIDQHYVSCTDKRKRDEMEEMTPVQSFQFGDIE